MHVTFTGAGRDALDAALARAPDHWRPMLLAVRDSDCGLTLVGQGRARFVIAADRPQILVVGDDMATAMGPGGFHEKSLRRFVTRCRAAVIIASAPVVELYAEASAWAATRREDVVLIETRPEHEADWVAYARQHAMPDIAIALATTHAAGVA